MPNWDPSNLPYQTPLAEGAQKPVRIPVAGPAPFNSLVVVRGRVFTTIGEVTDDVLYRKTVIVGTNFALAQYDQRDEHPYQHSTSVALNIIQGTEEISFVTAVDAVVDGFFDDVGRWTLVFDVGAQANDGWFQSSAYISSWVLCNEPPKRSSMAHSAPLKFENYEIPPRFWSTPESELSEANRRLRRFMKQSRRRREKLTRQSAEGHGRLSGEGLLIPRDRSTRFSESSPSLMPVDKGFSDD